MSRVINTESPGKKRSHMMRTGAELIRHLSMKSVIDEEAKDMAALLVFCLRDIDDGIDETVRAWEKRDYWIKAEKFRERWAWAGKAANRLEDAIRDEAWLRIPELMIDLLPRFADIKIAKFTRSSKTWAGAYERLINK
jgi:hypothetical protein